ncbi:Protein sel-1-like 1 [Papilio xuthus]|uniref:Protein sel-1-like 1 n=1 Tax=Papilio xuthus TaxID=66420 RepID=A0A194PFC9_PAPXU|nr:Protein sel-1-like 1 [Papilio xuthus]
MSRLHLLVIYLCISLSAAELLGPEKRKNKEKMEEDDADPPEDSDAKAKATMEYLTRLKQDLVYLQNAADAIKQNVDKDEEIADTLKELFKIPTKNSDENLEEMKYALKVIKRHPFLTQTGAMLNTGTRSSKVHDIHHQKGETGYEDIFSIIQDLSVEKEPELSPELEEAKELFDAAMQKLERRSADVSGAVQQVQRAAERGYAPARVQLAWSYIFCQWLWGAQGLGVPWHGTGLGVSVSQARALLHYTLGALAGSDFAQMALAYRHWAAVTVPASCPKAMQLYMKVAAKVAGKVSLSGGPAVQRVRLLDEAEGGGGALDTDLIEYYQLLADKGDVQAQVGLGQLHFQGGRGVTLDVRKAQHYFQQAANAGNAVANAFLGKIYLEGGDGVKPDNETALRYFRKAAELNNPVGQSGLGLMYLQGRGVPRDTTAALKYFTMAANQGWVEGQLHLGFMYFGGIGVRRDFKQANKYFSLASQSGHVLALYHLAQMHAQGLGVLRSCTTAVEVARDIHHAPTLHRPTAPPHSPVSRVPQASRRCSPASRGIGARCSCGAAPPPRAAPAPASNSATTTTTASAPRSTSRPPPTTTGAPSAHARPDPALTPAPPSCRAALTCCRIASEQLHSAQATFNLGYMHERGLGLARDPHLAKRCYDLAADSSPDARLPAALALARLHAAAALDHIAHTVMESPLAWLLVSAESSLLASWDAYLIAALAAALALVVLLRRPPQAPPHH